MSLNWIRASLCNLLIFGLIYSNLVVLTTLSNTHTGRLLDQPDLPIPRSIYDLFLLPHMFLNLAETVDSPVIQVRKNGRNWDDVDGIVPLDVSHFLPFRTGEQILRLSARKFLVLGDSDRLSRAQRLLATKILNQYNREHPEQPGEQIRFGISRRPFIQKTAPTGSARPIPSLLWFSQE